MSRIIVPTSDLFITHLPIAAEERAVVLPAGSAWTVGDKYLRSFGSDYGAPDMREVMCISTECGHAFRVEVAAVPAYMFCERLDIDDLSDAERAALDTLVAEWTVGAFGVHQQSPTWWLIAASASPATAPLLEVKLRYGPRALLALFVSRLG